MSYVQVLGDHEECGARCARGSVFDREGKRNGGVFQGTIGATPVVVHVSIDAKSRVAKCMAGAGLGPEMGVIDAVLRVCVCWLVCRKCWRKRFPIAKFWSRNPECPWKCQCCRWRGNE